MAIPFNAEEGFVGLLQFLAVSTNGLFFVFGLLVLFLIVFLSLLMKWDFDSSLLASSFGTLMFGIPLFFIGVIPENFFFALIVLFAIAVVKRVINKN